MLGMLRKEGAPSDRIVRVSSPVAVDGVSREKEQAWAELSSRLVDAALVLRDLPLGPVGASAEVGNETDRIARGLSTTSLFSKGTAEIVWDSDRSGDNDAGISFTIIPA
jgi:hypothetical protein